MMRISDWPFGLSRTAAAVLVLLAGTWAGHAVGQTPAGSGVEARVEALERSVAQMGASPSRDVRLMGVPLHGFADVGASYSSNPPQPGAKSTFALGSVDLYLTPQLSDRVKLLLEIVFEYDEEDQSLVTDAERIQFGYIFNDALTAWIGRYHTPYGFWNTGFHHGVQLQTSILRPRFLEFEDKGGILPSHTVGVLGSGTYRLGTGRLVYDAYVGNGSKIVDGTLDPNNIRADSNRKATGATVGYRFGGALSGLTLGAHAYAATVNAYDAANVLLNTTDVSFTGGYAVYDENGWEVLGEYYRFRNNDESGGTGTHASRAYYVQVAKYVGWNTTPFIRYERASLDQADPYFAGQKSGGSYTRHAIGLRYAIDAYSALKLETESTKEPALPEPRARRTLIQFAVRF